MCRWHYIESGLDRPDRTAQELAAFDSRQDDYFHSDSAVTVRRQVGGSTAMWGGRCLKFDPIDFEKSADHRARPLAHRL